MNVFEAVRDSVTARQAVEMYGIKVNRYGMALCPFHNDKNPSMKIYKRRYHCFGCQATVTRLILLPIISAFQRRTLR